MKLLVKSLIFFVALLLSSCGVSVMSMRDPGIAITKNIKKSAIANDTKKYKRMKACEAKFMRRFSRLYAKQQNLVKDAELTTPFFSTNANHRIK